MDKYNRSMISAMTLMVGVLTEGMVKAVARSHPAYSKDRKDRGPCVQAAPIVPNRVKFRRNGPCPCGSGSKFKKCCYPS